MMLTYRFVDDRAGGRWGRLPLQGEYAPGVTGALARAARWWPLALALAAGGTVLALGSSAPDPGRELAVLARAASDAGADPGAQLLLGLAYRDGRYGLQPDAVQALAWLQRAAAHGNRDERGYAEDVIGQIYAQGRGVAADPASAVVWWRRAAEDGSADAGRRLGEAYRDGFGTARDDAAAARWLHRACAQPPGGRDPMAGQLHSPLLSGVAAVASFFARFDPAQQGGAALQRHAVQGDALAQYQLALRYQTGAWGVRRDDARAWYWLQRAAQGGNAHAMQRMAEVYARGELGIAPDPVRADDWRRRAAGAAS